MLNQLRILAFKGSSSRPARLYSRSARPSSGPSGLSKTRNQIDDEEKDFRPPWVYSGAHILLYSIIPGFLLYSVFFAEFKGRPADDDHVFMPPRRWLARQKAAFFSLSPAEQALAKSDEVSEKQHQQP